ncbi:hypothetical protein D3C72_2343780 [compost metagenome]
MEMSGLTSRNVFSRGNSHCAANVGAADTLSDLADCCVAMTCDVALSSVCKAGRIRLRYVAPMRVSCRPWVPRMNSAWPR